LVRGYEEIFNCYDEDDVQGANGKFAELLEEMLAIGYLLYHQRYVHEKRLLIRTDL
jgi:hypothetical protein